MISSMRLVVAIVSLAVLAFAIPQTASADDAGDFLKQLQGSWRGRGQATIPGREEAERITCQVNNIYEEVSAELRVTGECASTLGKTPVNGMLSHNGSNVSGSLINAYKGATVTKSVGSIVAQSLEVSSNFVDNATGNLTRTRQVVHMSEGGFTADFYTFDNSTGTFKAAGSLTFSLN